MSESRKIVTPIEQSIIDAGGRVESFYDVFEELDDEEWKRYRHFAGIGRSKITERSLEED